MTEMVKWPNQSSLPKPQCRLRGCNWSHSSQTLCINIPYTNVTAEWMGLTCHRRSWTVPGVRKRCGDTASYSVMCSHLSCHLLLQRAYDKPTPSLVQILFKNIYRYDPAWNPESLGIKPSSWIQLLQIVDCVGPKKGPILFYYLPTLLVLIKHSDSFELT